MTAFDPFGFSHLHTSGDGVQPHSRHQNGSFSGELNRLNHLPPSLQGGISAVSSRRPSFAAEVSARQSASRVDFGLSALSPSSSYPLFSPSSPSMDGPAVDTSRWPPSSTRRASSLWSSTTGASPDPIGTSPGTHQRSLFSQQDSLSAGSPSPTLYTPQPATHPFQHHQSFSHPERSPFSRALFNSIPYNENAISDGMNNLSFDSSSSRRHSLATCIPEKNIHLFSEEFSSTNNNNNNNSSKDDQDEKALYGPLLSQVDSYFSHADRRPLPSYQLMASPSRAIFLSKLNSIPSLNFTGISCIPYPANQILYCVEFKAGRLDIFYVSEGSGLSVKAGDLVIVDADRGKDLGRVVRENLTCDMARKFKILQHQEQQAILQQSSGTLTRTEINLATVLQPKQILRFAQATEIQQLVAKKSDEDKARKLCLARVEERGMSMQVCDAEYQWDRRKLTFFYTAQHRIDFRDLVRDLFRIYKTRIWMCAVDVVPIDINALPPPMFSNNGASTTQQQQPATTSSSNSRSPIGIYPSKFGVGPLSSSPASNSPASPMIGNYFTNNSNSNNNNNAYLAVANGRQSNGFADAIHAGAPGKVWC